MLELCLVESRLQAVGGVVLGAAEVHGDVDEQQNRPQRRRRDKADGQEHGGQRHLERRVHPERDRHRTVDQASRNSAEGNREPRRPHHHDRGEQGRDDGAHLVVGHRAKREEDENARREVQPLHHSVLGDVPLDKGALILPELSADETTMSTSQVPIKRIDLVHELALL